MSGQARLESRREYWRKEVTGVEKCITSEKQGGNKMQNRGNAYLNMPENKGHQHTWLNPTSLRPHPILTPR